MPVMSRIIAGKEYTCQRCDKAIKKGEEYYRRKAGYRVHGRIYYDYIKWHVKPCEKKK